VRRDIADELVDLRLRVRRAATGAVGIDGRTELAQKRVAAPIRLGLVNPGPAFLSCILGHLRQLVGLRLDPVH